MVYSYKSLGLKTKYTEAQKHAAIEATKTKSVWKVSKSMCIPYTTLIDWKKNPKMVLGTGKSTVLDPEIENLIVEAILYTAKCGFPQTRNNIKDIVQSYVITSGKKTPFTNGRPGEQWM